MEITLSLFIDISESLIVTLEIYEMSSSQKANEERLKKKCTLPGYSLHMERQKKTRSIVVHQLMNALLLLIRRSVMRT